MSAHKCVNVSARVCEGEGEYWGRESVRTCSAICKHSCVVAVQDAIDEGPAGCLIHIFLGGVFVQGMIKGELLLPTAVEAQKIISRSARILDNDNL